MSEAMTGKIVTASFESGKGGYDCGLEGCDCPDHEQEPIPAGTYITVKLDQDWPVGLFDVEVREIDAAPVTEEGDKE